VNAQKKFLCFQTVVYDKDKASYDLRLGNKTCS